MKILAQWMLVFLFSVVSWAAEEQLAVRPAEFWIGADISWVPQDEAGGAKYYDHYEEKDVLQILRDHKFNAIRLRVFVEPLKGYARWGGDGRSEWCGKEETLKMAKRVKEAGMKLIIDFHYSDNWADPEKQNKPDSWKGKSVEELETAIYEHTKEVVQALVDQGTPPAMVAVGNEITHGMVWPEGRISSKISSLNATTDKNNPPIGEDGLGNYDNLARFLKAGIRAVKEIDPEIDVMLHNHLGRLAERVLEWMEQLDKRGVKYDVIGLSCYSQSKEGDWKRTFAEVAERYPNMGIIAAEYSNRKRYINDLVYEIPGKRGWGTFIWEPTRHREALFDRDGKNAGGEEGALNFIGPDGFSEELAGTDEDASKDAEKEKPEPKPKPEPPPNRPRNSYDANEYMDLYPEMAKDYGIE